MPRIEEFGIEVTARELAIYERRAGLPEAKREEYVSLWRKRSKGGPLPSVATKPKAKPQSVRGARKGCCGGGRETQTSEGPSSPQSVVAGRNPHRMRQR